MCRENGECDNNTCSEVRELGAQAHLGVCCINVHWVLG